ncbi:MAG: hypothetical protein HY736_18945 [Verrucomicrobia bacterium]|nr:hypothetical protein [Verrucomicrobiota bacterium]
MNSTKKVVFAAGALLLGPGSLPAQPATTAEAGLIGRRHAGLDFTYDHYNSAVIDYAFGAAAALNLPVNRTIDLSFRYDLSHTNDSNYGLNHNALHATVLTYRRNEYGNAYFAGTLGQSWNRLKTFGVLSRDDDALWALSTGYEIPVGAVTAINARLSYGDAFRRNKKTLRYRLEANHWFSSDFAGVASVSYNQVKNAPDTLLYTAGLRWAR